MTQTKPTTPKVAAKALRAETTHGLFRYQRKDDAPNKVTVVQIDAAHTATVPISHNIFGNFLEHLGGAVYETVWAQTLLNPNLEPIDEKEKAPMHWEMTGASSWQEGGYQSPKCVRLSPAGKEGQTVPGSLAQTTYLPVHRCKQYTLYVWVRAMEGRGDIAATLAKAGQTLVQNTFPAEKPSWRKLAFKFTLSPETVAKGEPLRLTFAHANGGPVDIDQPSLFPDDHFLGLDIEVMHTARDWQIPLLRWPGGNFASGYHWQEGIGLRELRVTRKNLAWGGVEPNHFGINEFIKFCMLIGAKPQLTVNTGNGTAQEAAAWVEYCNHRPAKNQYGLMRATNGSPEPYDAELWEIGNEMYGDWQIGHTDAKNYALRYVQFRDAMLQADPEISLIATGKGDEFTPEGLQRCLAWNETLLRAALINKGKAPDYLSLHPLVPLPGGLAKFSYAEQYESAMAHPTFLSDTYLPKMIQQVTDLLGKETKTRLALTEWGIIVGGEKWRESPNHDDLSGAIYNALTLNAMLRHSDWISIANMTALTHGGGIKKPNGVVLVDPQYWTQFLYASAKPHTPVLTTLTGPGREVPARGSLPAVAQVPDVDVFSALTEDANKLVVFVVNRHLSAARPLQLRVAGFEAASLSGTVLTASDIKAHNTIAAPEAVHPKLFSTPAWPSQAGNAWQVSLPPHSLVVLTLIKGEKTK